jgi:hypothetical protein
LVLGPHLRGELIGDVAREADDEPLGCLPQTYHQMDLRNAKTLGSPESIVRGNSVRRSAIHPRGEERRMIVPTAETHILFVMRRLWN